MNTSSLIGLLVIGLVILIWGGHFWWIGIGVIMMSIALAVGSTEETVVDQQIAAKADQQVVAKAAEKPPKTRWEREREEDAKMASVTDLKWRPSVPADGLLGINPGMRTWGEPVSIGQRGGQLTFDLGVVRFKDDLRVRLANVEDFLPEGKIVAWHFRTQKPIYQQPTKMVGTTIEPWDAEIWDGPHWNNEKKK